MKRVLLVIAFTAITATAYCDFSDAVFWDTEWSFGRKYSMAIALHQGFVSSYRIMNASGLSRVLPDTPESLLALDRYAQYTPNSEDEEKLDAFFTYVIKYIDGYYTLYDEPPLGEAFQEAIIAWDRSGKYIAGYGE